MTVKVYRVKKPYTPWMVRHGKQRKFFATRAEAEDHRTQLLETLEAYGQAGLQLSPHEAAEARRAQALLPEGLDLETAVRGYLKALREHRAPTHGPTLREAWVAFFETRTVLSRAYQVQLSSQCERLLEAIGWDKRLAAVRAGQIDTALAAGHAADETRANRRRMLRTFWTWARERYHLEANPFATVRRWRVTRGTPQFYSPAQIRRLLEVVAQRHGYLQAGLALRAFAGLRDVEVRRIRKLDLYEDDVRAHERTVLVRAEVAKATGPEGRGRPRLIQDLPPTLWAWLEISPALWWPANVAETLRPCFSLAGVERIRNGLRHSFATYAAAWYGSLDQAALVCGHDTAVLVAHYQGLATRAQAQEYFDSVPGAW